MSDLKRLGKKNPVIASILTLATVAAISLLAMILVLTIPADLGAPYEPLEASDSYAFDPWEISLGRLHISYPQGGVLVGAYRRGELTALVILGEGTAIYSTDTEDSEFPVTEIVLHAHPTEISVLRGQTYIEPKVLPESMLQAEALLKRTASAEPVLEIFGTSKVFLPRRGVLRVELFSSTGDHAHYTQAAKTVWTQPGIPPIVMYNADALRYPPYDQFIYSLSILSVMVAAVAAAVVFVTPRYQHVLQPSAGGAHIAWTIAVAIVHYATDAFIQQLGLSPLVVIGWRVMVIAMVLWIADTYGEAFAFLGFRRKGIGAAVGAGVLAGFLLYLCGSISFPSGFNSVNLGDIALHFFAIVVTKAIFHELLWRGLVQGSFRTRFGGFTSIGLTTILASLTSLAPAIIAGQYSSPVLIQSFFIVPLGAVILGFIYERTHNIFAPLATTILLGIVPYILHF